MSCINAKPTAFGSDKFDANTDLIDLVNAAKAGQRGAFDELCRRHEAQVLNLAYRKLGNWDEAQELRQDVFFQVWRKIGQLEHAEAFSGWLRQIVARMAINRGVRRRRLTLIDHEVLEATIDCEHDAEKALVREETKRQLHEQIALLRSMDRETLIAYYIDDNSMIEMAEKFHAPIGTIKRRLHTARLRLAEACRDLIAC